MHIRVSCPGIPNSQNPGTWPFPTAGLVSYDPVNGTAIFDVPDADAPTNAPNPGDPKRPNTPVGSVLIDGTAVNNATWLANLKARYPGNNIAAVPQIK